MNRLTEASIFILGALAISVMGAGIIVLTGSEQAGSVTAFFFGFCWGYFWVERWLS